MHVYAHLGQYFARAATPTTTALRRPFARTVRNLLPQQYGSWKLYVTIPGQISLPVCGATMTTDQARALAKQIVDVIVKPFGAPTPLNCNEQWLRDLRAAWQRQPVGARLNVYAFRNEVRTFTEGPITKSSLF